MQYGGRRGYSGDQRLYTPSLASRRSGERGQTLPDILWKASGVMTRPTSGLRLTVQHVDVPHAGPQGPPRAQRHNSSCSEPGRPSVLQHRTATSQPIRRNLQNARLLSRPQQTTVLHAATPSTHHTAAPKASRTMLPPLTPAPPAVAEPPPVEVDDEHSSTGPEDDSTLLGDSDSEEEICSDDEGEDDNPPSRPGFESETELSTHVFDVPFLSSPNPAATFPATLLQDHMQLNMERFSAAVLPSGLSARVNNVVRAFSIHGPLDRDLLSRSLNTVARLHPLLAARFQRTNDRLYMQIPSEPISVPLESPIVGHERPESLIVTARRKPFSLSMHNDLVSCGGEDGGEGSGGKILSVVSLASSKNSDEGDAGDKSCWKSKNLSRKSVTFEKVTTTLQSEGKLDARPSGPPALPPHTLLEDQPKILMRARLVRGSVHDATLVLSFPRIICDYWSSCLFVRQLVDVYAKLEKSSLHRPSLAATRIQAKRQEVAARYGRSDREHRTRPLGLPRELGVNKQLVGVGAIDGVNGYKPAIRAQLSFKQVALREKQLLKFVSKEKLWAFWDSMLTATIQRRRGPNRVKVVPPIRIPSGLGERVPRVRSQTSKLRPLTGRARPQTGRKMAGGMAASRDSLTGPKTEFHFVKFEEEVCAGVRMAFPEEHQASVRREELLSLVCLGAYVLLLGRCCRGWGEEVGGGREVGKGGTASEGQRSSVAVDSPSVLPGSRTVRDPLHQYKMTGGHRSRDPPLPVAVVVPVATAEPSVCRTRRAAMAGRLDLGSFLIGVEVSLRQSHPKTTQGLYGPLTNDVGMRVNLSSCETFVDLVLALGKTLQSVHNHHHFPFSTVTDELGVPAGLPVRFSYLYRSDTLQLSDPAHFYFPETAVGVKGHGLARLGSTCYLSPLCTKLDDSRHLELCLWEGYDSDHVGGVFLFQPQVLRRDLVEALTKQLTKLMVAVARDPHTPLTQLSSQISLPFSPARARPRRTTIEHP